MAKTDVVVADTAAADAAAAQEPQVVAFKRVIIQRPSGNTDSHIFLGFNSFEGHFKFDEVVELPAAMVDYFRAQKRPEFFPDEEGRPKVSYVASYNIVDA